MARHNSQNSQMGAATVAVITKGYPRISETFVAQELAALQAEGLNFIIYSLRTPHDDIRHPVHDRITAECRYLPEYAYRAPLRLVRAVSAYVLHRRFYRLLWFWFLDFCRDPSVNRGRRLAQAIILAHEMPRGIRHLYFHFIHTPATVARYAALLRGLPYSGSAHAKDIWTSPIWDVRQKLRHARWCAVCTSAGRDYLRALAPRDNGNNEDDEDKVHLVYHGLEVGDFPKAPAKRKAGERLLIVSVGRLVEKKGYEHLLRALGHLSDEGDWQFYHIGGGDIARFTALAAAAGLSDRVSFLGACARPRVVDLLRRADIFALANIVTADGDRDGIPNVLMEALWMEVAVVAGDLASIRELIEEGESGLLCDGRDELRFAEKLRRLLDDDDLRRRLASGGRRRMREKFLFAPNFRRLRDLFDESLFDGV